MARAAISIRFLPTVLETNGMLREARRLHSITYIPPFFMRYWMLNGPLISSASAIFFVRSDVQSRHHHRCISRMHARVFYVLKYGGNERFVAPHAVHFNFFGLQ